jgi:DNA-binding transcriptional regulator YiaG
MKVVPTKTDYSLNIRFDDQLVPIVAYGIDIPTCQDCGEKVITVEVDDQVNVALFRHLKLLLPAQIREGIERLNMPTKEIAARLGVSEDQLWRWANGFSIQSRAMDNYLRVFFQFPEVRAALSAPAIETSLDLISTPNAMT